MLAFSLNSNAYRKLWPIILLTGTIACDVRTNSEFVEMQQDQELIPSSVWIDVTADSLQLNNKQFEGLKSRVRIVTLREGTIKSLSELLGQGLSNDRFLMDIHKPDTTVRFQFEEQKKSVVYAEFPDGMKSFLGKSIDGTSYASIVITPAGLSGRIFTPEGLLLIDEIQRDQKGYLVTYDEDIVRDTVAPFREYPIIPRPHSAALRTISQPAFSATQNMRVFRIAVSATGEFTSFYGPDKKAAKWAIREAIEHVSNIYKVELGVVLDLVPQNERFIFADASTDPFTNSNADSVMQQNQRLLDSQLGDANYDMGHVFTTDPNGGKACIGSAGITGIKAKGTSGIDRPYGHKFIVDYLAHEIGHQLGANHIFNSCPPSATSLRNAKTAYEPGSGSTIMSYAGLCQNDDLQNNSDGYFNTISYSEIQAHLNSLNGLKTFRLNNQVPTVRARFSSGLYIPRATPFQLSAEGYDPDGDKLTYCWEQLDCDTAHAAPLNQPTNLSPIFRSFSPSQRQMRIFPRIEDILVGTNTPGELLPEDDRDLNFSVTVRDLRGGIAYSDVVLHVANSSGPFAITFPTDYVRVARNSQMTVRWDVSNTASSPVNCRKVRILLSVDGGSFFRPVSQNVDNDGEHPIVVSVAPTRRARIKVEAVDNVFFDVSDVDFEVH